jgi:hypothetical protein
MKAFFTNMSLARWIIVVSLVLSIALCFTGWRLHQQRAMLEAALVKQVPDLAVELQSLSKSYSKLYKDSEREGLKGEQADPAGYIRGIASLDDVQIGQLEIATPPATEMIKGVLDRKYTIKPQNRDAGFPRLKIANFLWRLENASRRVRVTHIHMETAQKNPKHEDVLMDSWKWEAEATSRAKKDETPTGTN